MSEMNLNSLVLNWTENEGGAKVQVGNADSDKVVNKYFFIKYEVLVVVSWTRC